MVSVVLYGILRYQKQKKKKIQPRSYATLGTMHNTYMYDSEDGPHSVQLKIEEVIFYIQIHLKDVCKYLYICILHCKVSLPTTLHNRAPRDQPFKQFFVNEIMYFIRTAPTH